jgi:hypothetical protein
MTILLDIINGLNKFLGFLDISPKYSNRAYTLLSIIPTVYILRIVYGPWIGLFLCFKFLLLLFR